NMLADISTFAGGMEAAALINLDIRGDFVVHGDGDSPGAFIVITNFGFIDTTTGNLTRGGTIASNATINLGANNVFGNIFLDINNNRGGTIGTDAAINANVTSISSLAVDDGFGAQIDNHVAGDIGGNAIIDVGVSGNVSTGGVSFEIGNNSGTFGGV